MGSLSTAFVASLATLLLCIARTVSADDVAEVEISFTEEGGFSTLAASTTADEATSTTRELATAPCQKDKKSEAAPACERVVIPDGFCNSCPVRPTRDDGNFADCTNVYDLTSDVCRTHLVQYIALNPCDTRRAELVARWDDASIERLDYFVYAMCELGCDSIPAGSTADQYKERLNATLMGSSNASETLWNVRRGNSPAHFIYDVCLIFPNFTHFALPKPCDIKHKKWESVCPELREWVDSPDAENWVRKNDVNISPFAQEVITEAMWALQIYEEDVWKGCIPMEIAQSRI